MKNARPQDTFASSAQPATIHSNSDEKQMLHFWDMDLCHSHMV